MHAQSCNIREWSSWRKIKIYKYGKFLLLSLEFQVFFIPYRGCLVASNVREVIVSISCLCLQARMLCSHSNFCPFATLHTHSIPPFYDFHSKLLFQKVTKSIFDLDKLITFCTNDAMDHRLLTSVTQRSRSYSHSCI